VAKQKLDLFEFAYTFLTEASAAAAVTPACGMIVAGLYRGAA
jgi:hypothetical protein